MAANKRNIKVLALPADCVKLAINELMDRKPDLCVSGINHGSNSSINVIYSGTMSAAIEGVLKGYLPLVFHFVIIDGLQILNPLSLM